MDNINPEVGEDAQVAEEPTEVRQSTLLSGDEPTESQSIDAPEWMSALPDEMKTDAGLRKFKSVDALAKSYKEMESYRGNSIRIPGEDATDEERSAFFNKLGRPESAEHYKLEFGEGVEVNEERSKSFRETAHTAGLTQAQVDTLAKWEQKSQESYIESLNEKATATKEEMKREWGPDFENNFKTAESAINTVLDAEAQKLVQLSGLGANKSFLAMAHNLGLSMKEDSTLSADSDEVHTSTEQSELDRIMATKGSDKEHPYWIGSHPEHKKAVERVRFLNRQIHGTRAAFAESAVVTSDG